MARDMLIEYLVVRLAAMPIENVLVLYLDGGQRLIQEDQHSTGCLAESSIYARQIVRRALELDAAGLIVAHNHPSGSAAPSRSDKEITRHLSIAANAVGVHLIDHYVLTDTKIISFRETGLI